MTSLFILAVLAASTLGYGSARSLLQEGGPVLGPSSDAPAPGLSYVPADAGSCPQACTDRDYPQAYYFAPFGASGPAMYACSVSTPATGPTPAGVLAGYQANGTTTCTVAQGDQVVAALDFSCLCQDSFNSPGFDPPTRAGCSGSCTSSLDGSLGQPRLTDAGKGNYGCIPGSEQGVRNRMGTAVGNTCYVALDGAVKPFTRNGNADDDTFSCLCQFQEEGGVATAG